MNWRRWAVVYGIVGAAHLVVFAADLGSVWPFTKQAIVLVLIAWAVRRKAPWIVPLALVFCWLGDLFLIWEGTFTIGMAAFALAHLSFIAYYLTRNAWARLKPMWWLPVVLAVAAIVVVAVAWNGIDDRGQHIGMPLYAVALVAMASLAVAFGRLTAVGGILFMVSDALIVLIGSHRLDGRPYEVLAMALYIAAMFFITRGILERESMRATAPLPQARV